MFQQENVSLPSVVSATMETESALWELQADPKTGKAIPAKVDTLWQVEVKTAAPVWNTQATPLSQSLNAVLDVQLLMKGLLDLRRQDF